MEVTFYDLSSDFGLKKLDEYLLSQSYITGYQASKDDVTYMQLCQSFKDDVTIYV
ncbi:elongation factor 1-delta [Sesbania bispinosa]|nr:elongation factor 1-delta [Sesbania bispinosa]